MIAKFYFQIPQLELPDNGFGTFSVRSDHRTRSAGINRDDQHPIRAILTSSNGVASSLDTFRTAFVNGSSELPTRELTKELILVP